MKTNSKIRNQQATSTTTNGNAPAAPGIPSAGNMEPLYTNVDYSAMYKEIEKIKDPVSFDELKDFYRMS